MRTPIDLNQSRIVLKQDSTLIAVIEMSLSSWLVAGIVPGVERQPLKKLAIDESALLMLLNRWRQEAEKAGRKVERITVAFEAGRDGCWLARWLRARGIEAHVIHASSVAVSREHRRAKTDRLDSSGLLSQTPPSAGAAPSLAWRTSSIFSAILCGGARCSTAFSTPRLQPSESSRLDSGSRYSSTIISPSKA
jgi:hypothetical protein